ncbi:MAG: family 43 glycosylhydrolase [Spirochaetaceae bacterium]|jgi:GH43 family beta-xylosidase|nr:family 43 glycosylhydrolase [Spirochaetaceae bacterium]
MTNTIKVYTREATEDYTSSLANSVHISLCSNGNDMPLNRNYGILFATGAIDGEDRIVEKGLSRPRVFRLQAKGSGEAVFGISAERVMQDGSNDESADGKRLLWTTSDFIHFSKEELLSCDDSSGDEVQIDDNLASIIKQHYFIQLNTTVDTSPAKLYRFPLAEGWADPVIFPWEGKYYFLATNDNTNDVGLYVREAASVDGLFEPETEVHLILDYNEEKGFMQTFWAPEFHVIGGELYILFAVSGKKWEPQSHMMRLRKGGDISNPLDWEQPKRVEKADGSFLAEGDITLDMTYFSACAKHYLVWSYRKHIGTPLDSGSMLYIASTSAERPWRLTGAPVLLSRPLFGWENIQGTINNEGPYVLKKDGKIYLYYSGGAAGGYTYAIGLLSIKEDGDILNPSAWEKSPCPLMSYYSLEGQYGPGHNSFFKDAEGRTFNVYHAQTSIGRSPRCTAIRQVLFRSDGTPVLDW